MPRNVSQLIYLERSHKQKHFGTSFIKIGTAVQRVRLTVAHSPVAIGNLGV